MLFALALASVGLGSVEASADGEPVAAMTIAKDRVTWAPHVEYERLALTVSCPDEEVVAEEFKSPRSPVFSKPRGDGLYVYELRVVPRLDSDVRKALKLARQTGDESAGDDLREAGLIPQNEKQSGHFRVQDGRFVIPDPTEEE
jgi:hypothetical protein